MLGTTSFIRFFHFSHCVAATKSLLSELRKKTGYTFTNCKKALELNENDLARAEQWLKEQAQILGWEKATKLSDRKTTQGLISVVIDNNDKKSAVMVEVNCETDFVAKNYLFQNITNTVAETCLTAAKKQTDFVNGVAKMNLGREDIRKLISPSGKILEDEVVLIISQVRENIQFKRAVCIKVEEELSLAGSTHPTPPESKLLLGKYGCILIYKSPSVDPMVECTAKQLSQHIIGMNPRKIGNIETDEPKEDKCEEDCLVHQEFLMDPETPISAVLQEYGIEIKEFVRFECGEVNQTTDAGDEENNKLEATA